MTMKTDDVIEQLATDLTPVRALRPPGLRASGWISGAVFYLAILTMLRPGFAFDLDEGAVTFVLIQALGAFAGVLAAIAAFASVVPGLRSRATIWAPIVAIGWLAVMAASAWNAAESPAILSAQHEWMCVAVILVGGAPLVVALWLMLRRGSPMSPVRTGLLAALAGGLLANFGACVSIPHAADLITLVWHGGAVLALVLVCIAGARLVLRWDGR
jgi:hypothetical protein